MSNARSILITGGAGFIGSHVVRRFVTKYPQYRIINLDALTYAGNLENLRDIENAPNYTFVKADICDADAVAEVFKEHNIDGVIHLAAESHVDRSITDPLSFVRTNVFGTVTLLNAAKAAWKAQLGVSSSPLPGRGAGGEAHSSLPPGEGGGGVRFYHVSTDEVYGSLHDDSLFLETTPYDPQSPYSASKAASDHFVRAYGNTYKLPFVVSNCSNNYGSHHFPEKLIPLMVNNIRNNKPLPVYGKGENVRDWLWVEDHAAAIDTIFHTGRNGETYNIGGHNEWKNIDLVHLLCSIMDKKLGRAEGESAKLITYVTDRAGHDLRYAIDAGKIERELGWKPSITFEVGLERTVDWYLANTEWLDHVTSGAYQQYYKEHYTQN
ncbi:MAG: dTDP-glucose 4,6-dehydratase [Flavobacteriales bacterium]|nr:dTDP-glucose 4,6-dehydratase [Flavobacteriales bacterium]